ncbi:ferredoxin-type protein NapF [Shewanella sp. WXL01]|uniref:Ferredoxin-type protein NapF n=1 Tax=Shewanella maritima TaxID=2520507 RepID=A0A411PL61_9GAMM|nr:MULTISPECIES: ferredoxin-type protein NapF [Shewanella]NKF51678.1 ferredoxin-type protein NapF [Shewanella sp. WXL01]QBF84254.1 ferredoxin-type protein NapF [Shewanella maritima]
MSQSPKRDSINHARRNLFRRNKTNALRPPWTKTDIEFTDVCTRCDKCIKACETGILFRGDGGFVEVDFKKDECTFCEKCVDVCEEPIFDKTAEQPWSYLAKVQDHCLTFSGVWCQSCKDACEPRAIRFQLAVGAVPKPEIDLEACTGCGACVAPCPNNSIQVVTPN